MKSPANIIIKILEDEGIGFDPADEEAEETETFLPVYYNYTTDAVINQLSVFDTSSVLSVRSMRNGAPHQRYGIQLRCEHEDPDTGWSLLSDIEDLLQPSQNLDIVLDGEPGTYTVHSISPTSGVIRAGKKPPEFDIHVFTANFLMTLSFIPES